MKTNQRNDLRFRLRRRRSGVRPATVATVALALLASVLILMSLVTAAQAEGTAFTYQGRLTAR